MRRDGRAVNPTKPERYLGSLIGRYETLDGAIRGVQGYIDRCHPRPHSKLAYSTLREVARHLESRQRTPHNTGLNRQPGRGARQTTQRA
jgi:hypothetical protein